MSTNILEYSYEENTRHLNDDEALEKYKREKALHPDALVVLNDHNCGHWDVEVYKTDDEKREYIEERARGFIDSVISMFRKA